MRFVSLLLAALLIVPTQSPKVDITMYAVRRVGPNVEIVFRASDPVSGRDLSGLTPQDITLLEDGVPLTGSVELEEIATDAATPRAVAELAPRPDGNAPAAGSKPAELLVKGAAVGIVFDASALTNRGRPAGDTSDYIALGRDLIAAFLEAGRAAAPDDPEILGLFVPLSVPAVAGETTQPPELQGFSQDRNALLNTLTQLQPRAGKTNLFDTVRLALDITAEAADRRGVQGYLLVVTDGGDTASAGTYDALLKDAAERGVRLLILGVGPEPTVGKSAAALRTLAESTGGAFLSRPAPGDTTVLYRQHVAVTGQSAYIVRYTTALVDDGAEHSVVIRIGGPASGESPRIALAGPADATGTVLAPLLPLLLRYALVALGSVAGLCAVITFGLALRHPVGGTVTRR